MKKTTIVIIVTVGLVIGGVWWTNISQSNDSDLISKSGIHWHPNLSIYIKGIKQEIPAEIGIGTQYASYPGYDVGMAMSGVHTHDATGVIHFEFSGLVHKEDLTLGQFFKIWGKDMNNFGSNMKMVVNGKENTEYGNYHMQDEDKIELYYE